MTQAAYRSLLSVRPDRLPDRYSATDLLVLVRLGPTPEGLVEAISTIPWDGHRLRPGPDRPGQLGQRCQDAAGSQVSELGEVVTSQPELGGLTGVEEEHHH